MFPPKALDLKAVFICPRSFFTCCCPTATFSPHSPQVISHLIRGPPKWCSPPPSTYDWIGTSVCSITTPTHMSIRRKTKAHLPNSSKWLPTNRGFCTPASSHWVPRGNTSSWTRPLPPAWKARAHWADWVF